MNRFAILGLVALQFFVAAAVSAPLQIGVSAPLTGPAAIYGDDVQRILRYANEVLAGGRYELVFEDDQCDGKGGVTVANDFVRRQIKYVIGPGCSSPALSAAPIYERSGVIAVSSAAGAPALSQAGSYIYRTFPSDVRAADVLCGALEARTKKLGAVTEERDFPQQLSNALREACGKQAELLNENFLPDESDFRSILLRLKSRNPDGLFINSQSEATFLPIFEQILSMKWDVPLFGAYFPGSPAFLTKAGTRANGLTFVDAPAPEDILSGEGVSLYHSFVERYGELKGVAFLFVSTFEAFRSVHEAVLSGAEPRQFLNSTCFNGIAGKYSFDRNGDIAGVGLVLKVIRNGKPLLLKGNTGSMEKREPACIGVLP